ncbi:unnamed protein product [Linum tenue]|uniref:Uncharacterized protein n=1 Tax=Linum tenue TaxID=586396 RepID=A0AAV0JS73_9ROSI|nr:unnamed protein product [Linum tenue]
MATLSVADPDHRVPLKPEFHFPSEFPYEFDSSPDTDSGDDEDDFFAGLTRRLTQQLSFKSQKNRVVVGSPESTLNGLGSMSVSSNGSPNGASSPTTTTTPSPFGAKNDTWDLIYEAAGQVARLKMATASSNGGASSKSCSNFQGIPSSGSFYPLSHNIPQHMAQNQQLRHEHAAPKGQWPSVWERQQLQQQVKAANWQKFQPPQPQISCSKGVYESGRFVVRPPPQPLPAWPPLQTNRAQYNQNQTLASSNLGTRASAGYVGGGFGSNSKRECAGTGVFLPRRYSNPTVDSKKKPAPSACSAVLLPAKVVHALNLNMEETASYSGQGQSRINASFAADYAVLLARRNALLAQQQQKRAMLAESALISHEIGAALPQEWTY